MVEYVFSPVFIEKFSPSSSRQSINSSIRQLLKIDDIDASVSNLVAFFVSFTSRKNGPTKRVTQATKRGDHRDEIGKMMPKTHLDGAGGFLFQWFNGIIGITLIQLGSLA